MHRFFLEGTREVGDRVAFLDGDARKIALVLRLREGHEIEVIDSAGRAFRAAVSHSQGAWLAVLLEMLPPALASNVTIHVAQALPKGSKMDFVVEKLVELGVAEVLPFACERSLPRLAGSAKLERWRRLARTAAQQCGRRDIPHVAEPVAFETMVEGFSRFDTVLFAWETVRELRSRDVLPDLVAGARAILVAVGPEGGFSHDEAERATLAGAHAISLGPRILRTETAALALTAVLQYLLQP